MAEQEPAIISRCYAVLWVCRSWAANFQWLRRSLAALLRLGRARAVTVSGNFLLHQQGGECLYAKYAKYGLMHILHTLVHTFAFLHIFAYWVHIFTYICILICIFLHIFAYLLQINAYLLVLHTTSAFFFAYFCIFVHIESMFYIYLQFFWHFNAYFIHISAYFLSYFCIKNAKLHIVHMSAYNFIFSAYDCIFLHVSSEPFLLARFLAISVPFQQALQQQVRVNSHCP